jgi:hypothetical protein
MVGGRARCLDAALEETPGLVWFRQVFVRHPQAVEPLGVIGAVLHKTLEHGTCVPVGLRREVHRAGLTPRFVRGVLRIAGEDRFEVTDRVLPTAFETGDAGELELRVDLAGIDLHRAPEALGGFCELAALQVDQPELVVGVRVPGVERRSLEVPLEAAPCPEPAEEVESLPLDRPVGKE